jgi:LuxR family maltose regulon positive regulatory protein
MKEKRPFPARVSAGLPQDVNPLATIVRAFPTLEESDDIWPVRIHTLGVFSLTLNGKPVHFDFESGRQTLEFLKALLALGGREVSPCNLTSALWPQDEISVAQSLIEASLHSLRDTLGEDCVLESPAGEISLVPDYCWVDVWEFESTIAMIRRTLNGDSTGKDAGRLELLASRLQDLYQGHFLSGEDTTSWSVSLRERLRIRCIQHLLDTGRYWESRRAWDRAITCYRRGLEVDDLVEEFYQRLMVCCLATKSFGEGIAVYRRCRKVLSIVLGLQPMPDTEALYHTLIGAIEGKHTA